jgi:hypothetical protein
MTASRTVERLRLTTIPSRTNGPDPGPPSYPRHDAINP